MQHSEVSIEKEPQEEGGTSRTSSAQGLKPQQTAEAEADMEQGLEKKMDVYAEAEEPER